MKNAGASACWFRRLPRLTTDGMGDASRFTEENGPFGSAVRVILD